jgi:poly-gamma-glutamate synthesis protein (capsule biosynthesis protein)
LKRELRSPVMMAMIFVLVSLVPPVSCSPERPEGQPDEGRRATGVPTDRSGSTRIEDAREPSGVAREPEVAALVPIAHLTSTLEGLSPEELSEVRRLFLGRGSREEAEAAVDRSDFEVFDSAGAVVDHVSRTPGALGLVPWNEVGPRVRVLAVDGESLLDPEAAGPEDYPLRPEGATVPDPGKLRRVVVGGDVVLDRGQNYAVIQRGLGLDFPLDGGYAAITGRTPEPSYYSEYGVIHQFTAERRGGAGAVREYLSGADLTLANLENPVVRSAVYHPEATTFTGDLRLMPVLEQAGIDGVTLGNNHVLDAGVPGLLETLGHLEDAGIAHAGAGADRSAAREPMIFGLGETEVGVLSYQGVPSYDWAWATETAPGTAPLLADVVEEDVERLRREVDLVVVMPHWGREYVATPEPGQVDLAHAAIDAGADLVVGGHAHWPKGIEVYEGRPIFYGVGNFLLDQSWSEETSTGIFAEITLYGDRVVQAEAVPFVLLDYAQPNFLVPEAGGERALRKVFSTSLGPEFEAYRNPTRR